MQLSLTDLGCTAVPIAVKLKVGLTGLKPGVTKLTFKATAGGKVDKDKLILTCNPGAAPSLGTTMQPVFTASCALVGCHDLTNSGNLNMEAGNSYAEIVGVASESSLAKGAKLVEPGNIKKSYLARKILGQGLAKFDTPMPSGCPVLGPCLTDEEKVQILTWIQAGAPNN